MSDTSFVVSETSKFMNTKKNRGGKKSCGVYIVAETPMGLFSTAFLDLLLYFDFGKSIL